jgi:hypothetical protein
VKPEGKKKMVRSPAPKVKAVKDHVGIDVDAIDLYRYLGLTQKNGFKTAALN